VAAWFRAFTGRFVTTRPVLTEVANGLAAPQFRNRVAALLLRLENDPKVRIVGNSDALYTRGLTLYAQRPDKEWSLTDCMSFVVMREEGIREALTRDHHFTQAGFEPTFAR
jgi:uncharacterized protein